MLSVRARPGIGSTRTQDSKACSELVAVGDERETTGTEAQDSPPPSGEESDLPLDEAAESLPDGYLTIGSPLERLEGAEAAYRRGDERGDGRAAHNLGVLLEARRRSTRLLPMLPKCFHTTRRAAIQVAAGHA